MLFKTFFVQLLLFSKLVNGISVISARRLQELDDTFETGNAEESLFTKSVTKCGTKCSMNRRCVSFFFNTLTHMCILHSDPFTYTVRTKSAPGWRFYITQERTGRCPVGFIFYKQLDLCYKFRPTVQALDISCPFGELLRIDSEVKQNYIMKVTDDIGLVYDNSICIQGINTGDGWTYSDGTPMTYFRWGTGQPKKSSAKRLRMIRNSNYNWSITSDTKTCSYLCEYR
ncbi:unnamed protein product [Mytilus edulis]|uniref:C-type lectin domain-containing protein n=1 Tax=Mytilus edulis TaxID=6550 RepID=A0A8S3VAS5_MYTED|nr:unnamed protein product [Mytilus edulis]